MDRTVLKDMKNAVLGKAALMVFVKRRVCVLRRIFFSLHDAACSDVAATVVGFVGGGDANSAAGTSVNEGEFVSFGINIRDDTNVSDALMTTSASEEDEVAFFQVGDLTDGSALGVLRTRRTKNFDVLSSIDETGETGAVEGVGTLHSGAIARAEILECCFHHAFSKGVVGGGGGGSRCRFHEVGCHGEVGKCNGFDFNHLLFCSRVFGECFGDEVLRTC